MTSPLDRLAALEPIFVWAPTARCGITLLQRLVTSSREILVYGENFLLCKVLPAALLEHSLLQKQQDAARARLLAGDHQFWASAAAPRADVYSGGLVSAFVDLLAAYETSTRADGFARWGVKHPEFHHGHLQILRRLMPRSRHLCLYRHPREAMRSMKARKWLSSPADAERYARDWSAGVRRFLSMGTDPLVRVVRYETLLAERDAELERLRSFLGVASLDASVLDRKVNTFAGGAADGHAPGEYIEPAELTDAEWAAIDSGTAQVRRAAGYE